MSDVESVDALIKVAGLVRSGRTGQFVRVRAKRGDGVSAEELRRPILPAATAENGVQLIQIGNWKRIPWLWHGFSTRLGGTSRAYCAEDAAGELNLGFTAADDRALVAQNRRLLAEAVTGRPDTPLVSLKQVHSKVVIAPSAISDVLSKGDGLLTAM